jgi:putative ABC transport system permease protein
VAAELRQRLGGAASGLRVQTADQRAAGIKASARGGLSRLGQISTLLLIAACLAMAAALGAAIWQRRPRLAEHDLLGMLPSEQWRALLVESGLVVGAGCLTGAAFGILGQVVIDSYLVGVTGFPVDLSLTAWPTITTFLLVVGSALVVVAIPGWFAAHVGAELAFEE